MKTRGIRRKEESEHVLQWWRTQVVVNRGFYTKCSFLLANDDDTGCCEILRLLLVVYVRRDIGLSSDLYVTESYGMVASIRMTIQWSKAARLLEEWQGCERLYHPVENELRFLIQLLRA